MKSNETIAPPDLKSGVTERRASPAPPAGFCLLVSSATGPRIVRLAHGVTAILGRGADATVRVDDPSMSRHHAKLVVEDAVSLVDLGSRNGAKIDGAQVAPNEAATLRIGSVLELGATTFVLLPPEGFAEVEARQGAAPVAGRGPIIRDPAMVKTYGLLDAFAPTPLNLLVLGETGVGKEILAEQLHQRSNRAKKPFVKLNCASFPETLLEAELFGYEKGAFTGATQSKAGLFEAADGGTLFLDEIGEVPINVQPKLLRALETGETQRLGSIRSQVIDVRVVSATNRDLRAAMAEGRFRMDLFFRLNGMTITIPPLRRRTLDITPLAEHFIARVSVKLNRPPPALSEAARAVLEAHPWTGNVRDLKNAVERAVVMCGGATLLPEHFMLAEEDDWAGLPPTGTMKVVPPVSAGSTAALSTGENGAADDVTIRFTSDSGITPAAPGEAADRQAVLDALQKTAGNQSQAAKLLGITRRALIYRLEMYRIARPRKR